MDEALKTAAPSAPAERPRWWRILRRVLIVASVLAALTAPLWGPPTLSRLAFFHARRIEFEGLRYAKPAELTALLAVDTLQSVWQPLDPLAARLADHPLVAGARVERRLPSTLRVVVTEKEPVALAPSNGRLVPVDGDGMLLPIDPAVVAIDLPVAGKADSTLMHLLDGIRRSDAPLFARITTADRIGPDEFRLTLGSVRVRTRANVTVARFKDILPVEADLARSRLRAIELDVRFRDQVIARLP